MSTNEKPALRGSVYAVELLFDRDYDVSRLAGTMSTELPNARVASSGASVQVLHDYAPYQAKEGVCAITLISGTDVPVAPKPLVPLLEQTRDWDAAEASVVGAKRQMLVADMMASWLQPAPRLHVFRETLAVVVRALTPTAIVWRPAWKLVDPARFLAAFDANDTAELDFLGLNVRHYNVQSDAQVMDTMGLSALGLPDLQVHFRDLDGNDVAHKLFNTAAYILDRGDVIEDGNTLDGIPTGAKWLCRHEQSLVDPARVVIDIDPGPPHAAGNRS